MTITEIAEKAGVSIGTVDRVLHKRGRVAEKTRHTVEAVIAEYGYAPNPIARTLKQNKPFLIGVLMPPPDSGSGYWAMILHGMKEAEETLQPFGITLLYEYFNRTERGSLLDAARKLLERPIQAMILAPIVPDEAAELTARLARIPYVFVDSPLPKASPLTTIAQNPYRGGQCAGHIMKLLKGSGQFTALRIYADAYNLCERHRGFCDFFRQDAGSTVIESVCHAESNEGIFNFLDELFAIYPDINGIFVTHTEGFIVGQYLCYSNRKDRVALISYDMQEQNTHGLLNGNIDCIISQRPEYQGYNSVYEIYKSSLLSQKRPARISVPIDILFKENASDYLSPLHY
ncbi:LacI family DNA-binding transcriptional regulator [Treponema brennaborense]|uniref:Transcriptional regulator, LacI family n=1 Tax=Treponema brennaborense (strain DSM 12168 / CIP 105900 / DD5/3) TaxID=906968 RepID=F4LKE0_TREBD|nr:LacI family DNA-binding transcriptional regulator [Treponema brennaborense]AEE16514.1 transcriptional regulator, LacI family [Treponema brennaborense DSM 12168]